MAEYIEREYVLKCMEDSYKNAGISAEAKAKMTRWLNKAPAADVRPVVSCCDCKHFQVNVSPSGYLPQGVPEWECRYWCRPTDPTDFCSYGEKREES